MLMVTDSWHINNKHCRCLQLQTILLFKFSMTYGLIDYTFDSIRFEKLSRMVILMDVWLNYYLLRLIASYINRSELVLTKFIFRHQYLNFPLFLFYFSFIYFLQFVLFVNKSAVNVKS